jgi:cytochrome c551/c552
MSMESRRRTVLCVGLVPRLHWMGRLVAAGAVGLTACGGDGPSDGDRTARHLAAPTVLAAVSVPAITPTVLFDWAERAYPQLFPGHEVDRTTSGYGYRYYPATDNYLGTDGSRALIAGALTQGALTDLGPISAFTCQVQPLACAVDLPLNARLHRVAAGPGYSLVVNAQGAGLGWGDGLPAAATVPQPGSVARAVVGLNGVASVLTGPGFMLAVTREGRVQYIHQGWGQPTSSASPIPASWGAPITLPQFDQVVDVGVCANSSQLRLFALRQDGSVWTMQADFVAVDRAATKVSMPPVSRLGHGTVEPELSESMVLELCGLRALDQDGRPWRLLAAASGKIQAGSAVRDTAVQEPLVDLSCSSTPYGGHCLGATPDGRVLAWGLNRSGQSGVEPKGPSASAVIEPRPVAGATGVRRVWALGKASYALRTDGTLLAWGQHLGPQASAARPWEPRPQFEGQGAVEDLAAHEHLVVLMRDGSVRTSGGSANSALGGPAVAGSMQGVRPAGVELGTANDVAMPPVAVMQVVPAAPIEGNTLTLHGGSSRDANGDPLTLRWSLLDRPEGSSATLSNPTAVAPTVFADRPGTYRVQLVVHDGRFDSVPTVTSIAVGVKPVPPPERVSLTFTPTIQALLQQRYCLSCHALDRKVVGPSFNDIATRYSAELKTNAGQLGLASRIRLGSTGVWGQIPMPPNPSILQEEAQAVVTWLSNPPPKK